MSEPVTLRLDAATRKRLDKLAKATERSRAALAADAVRQYLDLNEWQIAAIQAGVQDANREQLIDHAQLKAKWERSCGCGGRVSLTGSLSIEDYIGQDNPAAAVRVVLELIDQAETLLPPYPAIGRAGGVLGTRELVIGHLPYIIAYRIRDKTSKSSASCIPPAPVRTISDW